MMAAGKFPSSHFLCPDRRHICKHVKGLSHSCWHRGVSSPLAHNEFDSTNSSRRRFSLAGRSANRSAARLASSNRGDTFVHVGLGGVLVLLQSAAKVLLIFSPFGVRRLPAEAVTDLAVKFIKAHPRQAALSLDAVLRGG